MTQLTLIPTPIKSTAYNGDGFCASWVQRGEYDVKDSNPLTIATYLDDEGAFTVNIMIGDQEVLVVKGDDKNGVWGYAQDA